MSKRKGDPGYAAGWCIYYRYNRDLKLEPNLCEAGIDLDQWQQTKFSSHPCFLDDKGQSKSDALECEKLRRPTKEEILDHKKWIAERMNKTGIVMAGIEDWRKRNKGKSVQEIVECPACKGKLHLSIVAFNGHVHAECETDGCVSWME